MKILATIEITPKQRFADRPLDEWALYLQAVISRALTRGRLPAAKDVDVTAVRIPDPPPPVPTRPT